MPLIRNRKPSRVGLATTDGGIFHFEPGTHEYSAADIQSIDTTRKDVCAYLEGADPVIAVVDESGEVIPPDAELPDPPDDPLPREPAETPEGGEEPAPKKSAAELVAEIKESNDPAWLRSLLQTDERKTVITAADKRLAELEPAIVE
jgi:hypothetical protein